MVNSPRGRGATRRRVAHPRRRRTCTGSRCLTTVAAALAAGERHDRVGRHRSAGDVAARAPRAARAISSRCRSDRGSVTSVDLTSRIGSIELAQSRHDRVGYVGPRRRARPLLSPLRARCRRREVAGGLRVAGQPGASAASGDRRDVEQRRAAGPRSGGVAPRRSAPTRAGRRPGGREHLGPNGRRLRARGEDAGQRAEVCRRGRGEPQLPEPRRRCASVRALARRRRQRRCDAAAICDGRCGRSSARTPIELVEVARGRAGRGRRRRHARRTR